MRIPKRGESMRSMKQQLTYAVRSNTAIGQSKHSEKSKGKGMKGAHHDGRSYSYSTLNSRLDTAKQFGNWMKNSHPEIEMARDISADHVNEFLREKAETCRSATLESYASNLRALSREVNKTYHCQSYNPVEINTPSSEKEASRTMPMQHKDIERLKSSFKTDSVGHRAICMEQATGARVEGLTKLTAGDIRILSRDRAEVYIHGEKGGRNRTVDVVGEEHVRELDHIKEIIPEKERICPVKPDSLNKAFNRHLKQLGLKDKYELTSTHAMRKEWAQRTYDRYRENHSKLESVKYTNKQLGHGAERDQVLLDRYVANVH